MINDEIYSLIGSESFIMVNKKLLRLFHGSADGVVLLIELVNIHKMMSNKTQVDEFGYFKISQNWIKKVLGMSPGKQKTILNTLVKMELVHVIVKGFPATRHIALNFFNIKDLLEADETTKEDIQRQEFYDNINAFIKASNYMEVLEEERVFGNMKEALSNSIKVITAYHLHLYNHNNLIWTSRDVGVLRDFVNKKFMGKPVDYDYIVRIMQNNGSQSCMNDIVDAIIKTSKRTVENSPADQILDIKELTW